MDEANNIDKELTEEEQELLREKKANTRSFMHKISKSEAAYMDFDEMREVGRMRELNLED